VGILIYYGYFSPLDSLTPIVSPEEWVTNGILQLLISLVIMGGVRMLQEGYTKAQANVESTLKTLHETQMELENRVMERTEELARKTSQMNASTFVAHQTAAIQDLNALLNSTVDLIAKQFGYYHVALYLINERGDFAILQSASSEGGKRLLEKGHRLRVGTEGIIGFVAAEKKPRISLDVGEDSVFFDNPELPETRSELSLPLIVRNKVIGVLDMQSKKERAFH
jgi:signal transduction protein with GAF and PtsI domain